MSPVSITLFPKLVGAPEESSPEIPCDILAFKVPFFPPLLSMDGWLPELASFHLHPEEFLSPCLSHLSVQFAEMDIKSDFFLLHCMMILSYWDFQFERIF